MQIIYITALMIYTEEHQRYKGKCPKRVRGQNDQQAEKKITSVITKK